MEVFDQQLAFHHFRVLRAIFFVQPDPALLGHVELGEKLEQ